MALNRRVDLSERELLSRADRRRIEQLVRDAGGGTGVGAPGTLPLIPSAKELIFVTVTSTPYNMGAEDVLLVDDDTIGGDVTINLQAVADTFKYPRWIKKLGTTGKIILDPDGAETIDGLATVEILIPKAALAIISDGSNWQII